MKEHYLLLGYGSIGRRHARNLRMLRHRADVIVVDPLYHDGVPIDEAVNDADLCGAIIASPTAHHLEQIRLCQALDLPVYVEKPVCTIAQWREEGNREQLAYMARSWRCAVGFQYRHHPGVERLLQPAGRGRHPASSTDRLVFTAQDDLIGKYGPSVAETMAVHSIDLALFAQGPARYAELHTDGRRFFGTLHHCSGAVSEFDLHIDRGPRESRIEVTYERGGQVTLAIEPDDGMYLAALRDWLEWVHGVARPARMATLADGLAVMEIIAGAKRPEEGKKGRRVPTGQEEGKT